MPDWDGEFDRRVWSGGSAEEPLPVGSVAGLFAPEAGESHALKLKSGSRLSLVWDSYGWFGGYD